MRRKATNAFTLIEMLTVIVIVGIMLSFTIPAVTNLMKSSGVSTASRHVSNTLGLARQLAITQRVYARVVFPYNTTTPPGTADMLYRCFAVMTNRDNTTKANWRYASKWEYLPVGVVFANTGSWLSFGGLDDLNSVLDEPNLPFPDASGTVGQLAYIEFGPTGAAKPPLPGADSVVVITEGIANSGSTPTLTSKNGVGGLANVATNTVSSLVGRIKVTRP